MGDAKRDRASGSGDESAVQCPLASLPSPVVVIPPSSAPRAAFATARRHPTTPSCVCPHRRPASLAHRRCTTVHRCPRHPEQPPPPSAAPSCVCPCRPRPPTPSLASPTNVVSSPHSTTCRPPVRSPCTAAHCPSTSCRAVVRPRERGGKREGGMTGRSHHFI